MSAARPLPKGLMALIRIQDFRCAYCRKAFLLNGNRYSPRSPTLDHVWPRSAGHSRVSNVLVVHRRCNEAKGSRQPTGCELVLLAAVNAKRPPGCVGDIPGTLASCALSPDRNGNRQDRETGLGPKDEGGKKLQKETP